MTIDFGKYKKNTKDGTWSWLIWSCQAGLYTLIENGSTSTLVQGLWLPIQNHIHFDMSTIWHVAVRLDSFLCWMVEGKDKTIDAPPSEYNNLDKTVSLSEMPCFISYTWIEKTKIFVAPWSRSKGTGLNISKVKQWRRTSSWLFCYSYAKRAELDWVPFYFYGMKQPPDFVFLFMTTFGFTAQKGKTQMQQWKPPVECNLKFKYPELFHLHYEKRGLVN